MSAQYAIGLDYGTNSVRALVVNAANGREVATAVWGYEHGTQGVILSRDPNLARQHPADYLKGAEVTVKNALAAAKKSVKGFSAGQTHCGCLCRRSQGEVQRKLGRLSNTQLRHADASGA